MTDQLFNTLIEKVKQTGNDTELITKAYEFAVNAHSKQLRRSGDPYINHPLEVAIILAGMYMDSQTIAAGILHDVIEDTDITHEKLSSVFGEEIAQMVEGVTKLGKIHFTTKVEAQVENFRKMFLAMAKDLRVMLIKLADRLHNMRTLEFMPDDKRREKALETIEVFAPIAHRLGIFKIKVELEDLSLKFLDPIAYEEIVQAVSAKMKENENYINNIIDTVSTQLDTVGIKCNISGRIKHYYSIFKKMFFQNKNIDEVYDIYAVRVLVDSLSDCYSVLGLVHELFKPIPGRIKDYIAMPKPNMYQSLHTTIIGNSGTPCEIQIRTFEMHAVAENGIAAHWKYKEGVNDSNSHDNKLTWIRKLLDIEREVTDEEEFMQALKVDLFADEVFVFTPNGDVKSLPAGSCPIDFAYSIHTALGSKLIGSKVNGKLVPLEYVLQNGDIVEILTSSNPHGPSRDWLKIVKTSGARNKINQWFKKERREENILHGKEMLERELRRTGYSVTNLMAPEAVALILKKHNFNNLDDLYSAIGYGGITSVKVAYRLRDEYKKKVDESQAVLNITQPRNRTQTSSNGIIVKDIENCLVRISRCCNPVPGDDIVGYITRGRGVSVHRSDCVNVVKNFVGEGQSDRMIEVEWEQQDRASAFLAQVLIIASNRSALLADITNYVNEMHISVSNLSARITKNNTAQINMTFEISGIDQLDKIIQRLRTINGVETVYRNTQ